jgi:hypothetical protein
MSLGRRRRPRCRCRRKSEMLDSEEIDIVEPSDTVGMDFFVAVTDQAEEERLVSALLIAESTSKPPSILLIMYVSILWSILYAFIGRWPSSAVENIRKRAREVLDPAVRLEIERRWSFF